jgi:hypothetical protein
MCPSRLRAFVLTLVTRIPLLLVCTKFIAVLIHCRKIVNCVPLIATFCPFHPRKYVTVLDA